MNNLFQNKSVLAKLLAEENLVVEHRKVPSAHFDLNNRVIILPYFKEMDGDLYDLLLGHEVGHGLFTPPQGWHDALVNDKSFKSYLNVIEDARIERKIKEKYPGLRRPFSNAYKKLYEDDFFEIKGRDVNKLRFIDRINVFFKLGAHVRVVFTPEELLIVNEITSAQTWEEVEAIARKIYNKAKEDAKNEPSEKMVSLDDLDDIDPEENDDESSVEIMDGDYDESEKSDSSEESDESKESEENDDSDDACDSDESNNESDSESDSNSEDDSEDDVGTGSVNTSQNKNSEENDKEEKDVMSETDKAFRNNEQRLVDTSTGDTFIANLPKFNKNYMIPHKMVHDAIRSSILGSITCFSYDDKLVEERKKLIHNMTVVKYQEFVKRTTPVVNYMVKEFEMRKNATQLARAKSGKSGKINPKKLSRYNLDTDIFQRITTVPNGKNHGLVMFIDLSKSMDDIIGSVFEQAIVLTQFCKKVNIPFEVYGFSNASSSLPIFNKGINYQFMELGANDLYLRDTAFHLKQYLSSNMNGTTYRESAMNMLFVGSCYTNHYRADLLPTSERLCGTPLDECIVASIDVVKEFKENYRLDNVNAIFLTDGEGSYCNMMRNHDNTGVLYFGAKDCSVYLQNKDTAHRVRIESKLKSKSADYFSMTRGIIELAKMATGAKYTGYYIGSKREIVSKNYRYEYSGINGTEQLDSVRKKISEEGFLSSNKFGFNEYFMVLNNNLKIEEGGIDVAAGAKKGQLSRSFIKSMNGRNLQRIFLNKFMENIAA